MRLSTGDKLLLALTKKKGCGFVMEYLSPSRIHLFNQCPLSFSMKYIEAVGASDPTTDWYAKFGTLCHEIYEGIANKSIVSLVEAYRKFDLDFSSCDIPDEHRPTYYKQGKQSIEDKFSELQSLDILGIEQNFNVSIDFAMPPLFGYMDLVYRDSKGRLVVRDYKTSKPYNKTQLNQQYQPYVYAIACESLYGELPYLFEFDFVRFGAKSQFIIDENFKKLGIIKVKAAWNKIKSGVFPAKWNPFFCQNFCESRNLCALYMKKNGI